MALSSNVNHELNRKGREKTNEIYYLSINLPKGKTFEVTLLLF